MFRRTFVLAALAAFVFPAAAAAGPSDDARVIARGLTRAVASGRLTPGEAYRYRLIVRRSRAVLTLLPYARRTAVAYILHEVALQARRFTRARALTLFSMLETNADYLAVRSLPPTGTDIRGRDGTLYRAGWGGLQFHPLGNFISLNVGITRRRDASARRLALALAKRGVGLSRGAVWEYYMPYGGGWPPWTSGMAQAVAAHGFARAWTRFGHPSLLRASRRAYRAIGGRHLIPLSTGPWIRLYSFSDLVVLNAQLQSVVSLAIYAALTGDRRAAVLSARLRISAARLLHRFDTGYWSRYSLGNVSPLKYHVYVVALLEAIAARTGSPFWTRAARRFDRYLREPPKFGRGPSRVLYPVPADGFRDTARIAFWVSKPSTVRVLVGGERHSFSLGGGWHAFYWSPGRRRPGEYRVFISGVDLAGNRASARLQRIVVKRDTVPPVVRASVIGRRLYWRAYDAGSPSLRLGIRLRRGDLTKRLYLGRFRFSGSLLLPLPRGRWEATLVALDASGNRRLVELGLVPKR